ncbi:MAG: response regulator [Bacteroidales bacterium]|nr:response regulator [Bacteroidales bacterium]
MRTYQKGFEQNSLVSILTFIILYVMVYLSSDDGSYSMFSWPSVLVFSLIIIGRFLMYLFAADKKSSIYFTHFLIYTNALYWSVSYGLELMASDSFADQHMLLIIFIMGIAAAGALGLSKDNMLTKGFLFSLLIPASFFSFFFLQRLNVFIGVAFLMYLAYLVLYSKKYYLISQENLLAKIEVQTQKEKLEVSHQTLSKQNARLAKTLERAKSADKAKSLFLANMSHEIRTPLNGIIGMAHLMLQEKVNTEQEKKISIIQFSAETLVSLVNDILDFSKIEAGKLELDINHFNLHEVIKKIGGLFELKANEKNLVFKYHIDENVPVYIQSDQTRIKQILINLINNAIKFTSEGSVELVIKLISHYESTYTLRFDIIDNGIGISEENQAKIFTSFTQTDASFTRKFGGTGLGLAISRKLTKLMGGEIGVQSELGKGADFWFTIEASLGDETKVEKEETKTQSAFARKLHILLAEDNSVNVLVAKQIIEKAGHQVTVAKNGLEAVELFKNGDFELILMDIMMPEMDGLEATKMIRQFEKEKKMMPIPIIALTANVIKEDQDEYLAAGMNDFMSKPIHPHILVGKIQHLFVPHV